MLLEELTLENFRAYRGRHVFDLRPTSRRKPIVLVTGLNGTGKTTLLEALNVALYGKLAPASRRDARAYEAYLEGCLHHGHEPAQSAAVTVKLSRTAQGSPVSYEIHRRWSRTGKGLREQLEVWRDGELSTALAEDWGQFIEEMLPSRLAPLFFFDGEKIEALADLEATSEVLSVAIHSLLGLDLVDQLATDLGILERRKRSELKSGSERTSLADLERQVDEARDAQRQDFERLRALQEEIGTVKERLRRAERQFEAGGGVAYEARRDLEEAHRQAQRGLEEAEDELRRLAEGLAPLLLVEPLLARVVQQVAREREARESRTLGSLLQRRDREMVELLEASGVDAEIIDRTRRYLEDDRKRRKQRAAVDEYLNLTREGERQVAEELQTQLPELRQRLAESQKRHAQASSAVEACEQRLAAVPEEESIARLRQPRDAARRRLEELERELAAAEAVHQTSRRTLEERETRLTAEINRQVEQDLARDDLARILTHSQRVRETLETLREQVLARHVDRIQNLVLEGFRQLLRKSDLVAQLEIDPADFSLHLYGPRGQRVLPENLSAGERQLLAVSLLWGLARASGRPMPTLIDTPLGRLDSTHRMHLVERYFPFASHQVVLLSTDEEITGSYLETLRPKIGRSYLLDYDSASGSSTIREGLPENGSR